MRTMQIYDVLRQDHRMVERLIEAIFAAPKEQRKDIFSYMRAELIAHAKAEEEVVYRPLREHVDAELIELSFDDHEEIERLLADLSSSSAEDNKWLGTLRALKQVVLQHVEMEETDLFRLAQRNFTPREAEQIALDMLEEKGRLTMENPFAIMSRKFKEFIHGESHR